MGKERKIKFLEINMNGNLETQVKEILQKDDWQILANAYYKDPITQKPREKDIIATSSQFSEEDIPSYNARLFIECKYFPEETEIYSVSTNASEIKNTIFAFNIPFANISEIERYEKTHFDDYKEIFGSKDSKDFLYPAINQNLQSFDAFRKNNSEGSVYYLIVVYDGKLISTDQNKNKKTFDNALVKVDVLDDTFNLPYKKCFIELVSISQFEHLLKKIREDISKINGSVRFYYYQEKNRIEKNREQIRNDSCR